MATDSLRNVKAVLPIARSMTNTMAGVPVSFTEFRVTGPQGSRAYDVAPMEHLDSLLDIIDQGEARFGERLFAGERFLDSHVICPLQSHPLMFGRSDGKS
jgi:hypothetical protein